MPKLISDNIDADFSLVFPGIVARKPAVKRVFVLAWAVAILMIGAMAGKVSAHQVNQPHRTSTEFKFVKGVTFVSGSNERQTQQPARQVTLQRIEIITEHRVNSFSHLALQSGFIKVAQQRDKSLRIDQVLLSHQEVLLLGRRLTGDNRGSVWLEQIKISIPRQYLSSADVLSLQKELERLGIKIKPRPQTPKPTTRWSG